MKYKYYPKLSSLRVTILLPLLLFMLLITTPVIRTFAISLPQTPFTGNSGVFGDQNLPNYSILLTKDVSGSLYVKLPSNTSSNSVSLYTQTLAGGGCSLLGTVTTSPDVWVKIADNVSISANYSSIIQGQDVGAEPYAAAANILVVPSNICIPDQFCNTEYSKFSGYILPNLICNIPMVTPRRIELLLPG